MKHINSLRVLSVFILSSIMIVGNIICGVFWFVLFRFNIISVNTWARILPPLFLLVMSAVFGMSLTILMSRRIMLPLREMLRATRAIADGDYSVRLSEIEGEGEFQELLRSFNIMARELQGTEILRNDFIDNFSHEFKTPIASIRGFAKRLLKGDMPPEQTEEYLRYIAEESERLSEMSTAILRLSSLENQVIPGETLDFSLDEQLRDCILALENRWSAKNIEVSADLPEIPYRGSAELLALVWMNLLENAVKYTPDGGKIAVSAYHKYGTLTVEFADTGIGMTEETLSRIFDKFYQSDHTRNTKGNGLGLSIVRRAIELCGGDVAVESQPGIGSVFRVKLPYKTLKQ